MFTGIYTQLHCLEEFGANYNMQVIETNDLMFSIHRGGYQNSKHVETGCPYRYAETAGAGQPSTIASQAA